MPAQISAKLKTFRVVSLLTLLLGAILLTYMITVENEPGAIPLFLVLTGTVSFVVIQKKIKSHVS